MDRLGGYGLGPNLQRLIQCYWDKQKVEPNSRKYFGRSFRIETGVTHGDLVFQTIFNILVDAVVRVVILEVCEPQEAHHSFGWSSGK